LGPAAVRHYLTALSNLYRYADFERVVASDYNPVAIVRQRLDASPVTPHAPPMVDRRVTTRSFVLDAR
jgi:hypothetical protein